MPGPNSPDLPKPPAASSDGGELKLVSDPDSSTSKRSRSDASSGSTSAPPDSQRDRADGSRRGGLPIWLFVLVLVFFAVALGWQFQVAGQLEQEVASLEAELAQTQSDLGAHQSRLIEIRSGVRDLTNQLMGLQALVDAEPTDSVSKRDAAPHEDSGALRPKIPARLPQPE